MPAPYERISDDERQGALNALGEHFSKGHLNLDEFEERSERAAASVTVQELDDLFTDLPLPHYETGLAVCEDAKPPTQLSDEQTHRRKQRLDKIEEVGWGLAGLWIPFWFIVGGYLIGGIDGVGWVGAFIPMFIMGAYSTITGNIYPDDDEADDDDGEDDGHRTSPRDRKRAMREERPAHHHELPPSDPDPGA